MVKETQKIDIIVKYSGFSIKGTSKWFYGDNVNFWNFLERGSKFDLLPLNPFISCVSIFDNCDYWFLQNKFGFKIHYPFYK
jgi:hypothetical protein